MKQPHFIPARCRPLPQTEWQHLRWWWQEDHIHTLFSNQWTCKSLEKSFLTKKVKDENYKSGTTADFIKALQAAFAPSDTRGNARAALQNLKQTGTADKYVSQFQILAGQSGIIADIPLIKYFKEGLKLTILDKIYALEKIPTTIAKWYTEASQINNQWHQAQEIKARNKGTTPLKLKKFIPWYTNNSDPNAMDIDQMTIEEWANHMKKGLCFGCHQPGHIRKNCSNKMKKTNPVRTLKIKKTGGTAYTMIQSLYNELDKGEELSSCKKWRMRVSS